MRFGICGYGNLGKAAEQLVLEGGDTLVGIFSRRANIKSLSGTKVFLFSDIKKFEGKIDVMLMCGGSQEDLEWQSAEALKYFNIIDTFDTHARIENHRKTLEKVAKSSKKVSIFSCGWDPGLFSIMRALSAGIFNNSPQAFWGKGVSQGHSEALRNVRGVQDAIQYTIPIKEVVKSVKANPSFAPEPYQKHERLCYICLDNTRSQQEVEAEIRQMPNYFKDQKVMIEVVSQQKINSLKKKMFHKGMVLGGDSMSSLAFDVKMQNNPHFTCQIMLAFARAIPHLAPGAYSPLDIPIGLVGKKDNSSLI